jgi:GGDEF domain-containing protein
MIAAQVAERLRDAVAGRSVQDLCVGLAVAAVTTSVGIATLEK